MDATPRLRPLDLGQLLDATFRVYGRHYWTFAAILAIINVPLNLLSALLGVRLTPDFFVDFGRDPGLLVQTAGLVGLVVLLSIFGYTAMEGAVTYAAGRAYLGAAPSVDESYSAGLGRLWSLLGASILVILVVLAPLSLAAAVLTVASASIPVIPVVLALSITVVGIPVAVYFGVRWAYIFQAVVLEGLGARAALARSSALVRGTWWRVLGILIVVGILYVIASMVVGAILGVVLAIAIRGEAATAIASALSGLIVGVAVGAFPLIATTLLYYDLRVRKEGFGAA